MQLKVLTRPLGTLDGVALDQFRVGDVYDLETRVAFVFLTERWAEPVAVETEGLVSASTPVRRAGTSILVVDDDPAIRDLTEWVLTGGGYHVTVACHGRDALQRLCDACPDLILLDLQMPVMDGWEFRAAQRALPDQRRAAVPVLVFSAAVDAGLHVETLHALGVVPKPFAPAHLLHAVSAAVRLTP